MPAHQTKLRYLRHFLTLVKQDILEVVKVLLSSSMFCNLGNGYSLHVRLNSIFFFCKGYIDLQALFLFACIRTTSFACLMLLAISYIRIYSLFILLRLIYLEGDYIYNLFFLFSFFLKQTSTAVLHFISSQISFYFSVFLILFVIYKQTNLIKTLSTSNTQYHK